MKKIVLGSLKHLTSLTDTHCMIVAINKRKSKNDDNVKNKDEVRNELLSYVQNYFVNSSKASLVTTLNGLYNHEEVNCAKFLMSE